MARAYNIYVVMRNSEPLAAFTVKHELASWFERNADDLDEHGYRVYVCRDGGSGATALWRGLPASRQLVAPTCTPATNLLDTELSSKENVSP